MGIMNPRFNRRSFLKKSAAVAVAAPFVTSLEEYRLLARESDAPIPGPVVGTPATLPMGTIGQVKMSRVICGGNLVSGYAHSRDLIYVSNLLKAYFTDAKIMETWALCEQNGINTMIFTPSDQHALRVFSDYLSRHPEALLRGRRADEPPIPEPAPAPPAVPPASGSKP